MSGALPVRGLPRAHRRYFTTLRLGLPRGSGGRCDDGGGRSPPVSGNDIPVPFSRAMIASTASTGTATVERVAAEASAEFHPLVADAESAYRSVRDIEHDLAVAHIRVRDPDVLVARIDDDLRCQIVVRNPLVDGPEKIRTTGRHLGRSGAHGADRRLTEPRTNRHRRPGIPANVRARARPASGHSSPAGRRQPAEERAVSTSPNSPHARTEELRIALSRREARAPPRSGSA